MSENEEIDNVIYTKEDQINISSDYINNEQIQCQPCSLLNKTTFAVKYCNDCYENLCEKCVESHARRKATSTHKPLLFDKIKKASTFKCSPCVEFSKISSAVTYCKDCEEYLCTECTRVHKIRKATRFHEPLGLDQFKNQTNHSDEIFPSCVPCKYNNINSHSLYYCEVCEENLCERCTVIHRSRKATHKHVPIPISLIKQRDNEVSGEKDRKLCFPCQIVDLDKLAKSICIECEELLCDECTNQHRSNRITKTHTIDSPKSVEFEIMYCDICGFEKEAVLFCNMCDEALCDSCAQKHAKRKASKTHSTKPVEGKILKRVIVCDLCEEDDEVRKAVSFCKICEENYCETCTQRHITQKATTLHELTNPKLALKASKQKLEICDECKDTSLYSKATYHCLFCNVKLCQSCKQAHKEQTSTTNHKVVDYDAVQTKYANKQHRRLQTNSHYQLVSVEKEVIQSMATLEVCGNKGFRRKDIEKDVISKNMHEKDFPGKPRCTDIVADSLTLSWDPPTSFRQNDYYEVSFKDIDYEKKWKCYDGKFKSETAVLRNLKSNTAFSFRVRVVNKDGEGPYSEESSKVITLSSTASRIVNFSVVMENGNPSPTKYALPKTEVLKARNVRAKTKQYVFGTQSNQGVKSKTIMLVGATGTGKSTLVDGIVNYVLGVNWDDPFRFTVIDLEQETKDRMKKQALSQTEWITCYTINTEKDSRLKYQLHIIDTPGLQDREGLNRNHEIVEQIRQLFSEKEPKGVTFIDALCFLVKAPDSRLTAVQSYILKLVMSLFGQGIENNICSLVTFAAFEECPVLAALETSGLPFGKHFTFNNSGLFARNSDKSSSSLSSMFWDMGLKNFRGFFDYLDQLETQSLELTQNVHDERSQVEATIKNLKPQIDAKQRKAKCLREEIQMIERQKLFKHRTHFKDDESEMQQKYQETTGKLLSKEQIVEKLGGELSDLVNDIEDMMLIIKSCNERLKTIAPRPMSMIEHIDLMIKAEQFEQKAGFLQRIHMLYEMRSRALAKTNNPS